MAKMAKIFNKSRLIYTIAFAVVLVLIASVYRLPNVAQAITATPSASTQCAQILLSVSPVVSPTTSTTQTINMSASGGGLYQFNVYQRDSSGNLLHTYSNTPTGSSAAISINLVSGSNILTVSVNGEVGCTGPSGQFTTFVTTQTTTATDGSALVIVQSADGTPYSGTPYAIPGKVEAENFNKGGEGVAYHDTTTGNSGGQYRTSENVDIQTTTDSGGGYNIGWTATGEWLKYTVNVQSAGSYNLDFRVSSTHTTSAFHLEVDGSNVTGTLSVPNTGGWQTWTDVTKNGVNLSAGQHVLRWYIDAGGMNFNWFKLTAAAANLPDLTVSSIFIAPPTGCNNILGTQVTVKNSGTADAASFVVQLAWGSSTTGATQTVSGLAAGQSIAVRFVGDQGGSATATADSTNVIAESNETNNSLTTMVPVPTQVATCTPSYTPTFIPADPTRPNAPDLTLSIAQGIFDDCRSLAPHGVTVTVHNIGTADAGPFVVRATGAQVLDQSVDGLAAGQSINLFFNVSPPNGAISSFADSTFVIVELIETNNSGTYLAPTLTPRVPCTPSTTYTPGGPTVTNTPTMTPSKTPLPSATPTRPIVGS